MKKLFYTLRCKRVLRMAFSTKLHAFFLWPLPISWLLVIGHKVTGDMLLVLRLST